MCVGTYARDADDFPEIVTLDSGHIYIRVMSGSLF